MIAVLHNIRSLHNVGSIFRTADAAAVEKLYLCGLTPAPIDAFGNARKQIVKVALGAENYVPWEKARSTAALLKKLKKDGYKILALEQSKRSVPYSKFLIPDSRFCLVVGNEIKGLDSRILKFADKILEIPMLGKKESLNVSVAFGIVAYHLKNLIK